MPYAWDDRYWRLVSQMFAVKFVFAPRPALMPYPSMIQARNNSAR